MNHSGNETAPFSEGEPRSRFWVPELTDEAFARATQLTFQGASDGPESHYYQAPPLSPEETAAAILARAQRVAAAAVEDAACGNRLRPQDVEEIHQTIFGPIFGEQTLKQRAHHSATSVYGITKGRREDPYETMQSGTGGRSVAKKMREAFVRFEEECSELIEAAEAREPELIEAVRPAAKLYARLLAIHPFVDGNGRTCFCVLAHSLIRCGAVAVGLPEDERREFHWCLGQGMRKDRAPDYEPLAQWITDEIRASSQ